VKKSSAVLTRIAALTIALAVTMFGMSRANAAEPYDIYAILSLTGPLALLGGDAQTTLQTIQTLVNKTGGIHGQPIRFLIADDGSQPATAVQLANSIIAKNVPVILGPTYGASCLSILPLVRTGPVLYCFAPAIHPPPGSYAFSASTSTFDSAQASFTFALSMGWKRLAVLSSTDAAGQDQDRQVDLVAANPKYGALSVVDREHFGIGDISLAAQATRLKASNPDAIILNCVGTPTGTALRSLKDAGLEKVPVITNQGNLVHAELEQFASFVPERLYLTAPRFVTYDISAKGPVRDAQRAFYDALRAQGIEPDGPHSLSWDATLIVVDALRRLGTGTTAAALRDYLEAYHGYAGTIGIFDFRDGSQRGVGLSSVVVVRWSPERKTWSTVSEIGGKAL
jgi:branched-chain amino acid transport system substrate-binding protein